MGRLIDADTFRSNIDCCDIETYNDKITIIEQINEAPTVDAVEVVRCRDCKHWLKDVAGCTDFFGRCEWANYMVGAVGYCVYGERKDGDGNG